MPSAVTMALAYNRAMIASRGRGMPGIREGMVLGRIVTALTDLVTRDLADTPTAPEPERRS